MISIYNYTDFRAYLADYYAEKKKNNPSFSYQTFTEKCGFKNKSFIHQIIHTKKQISKSSIYSISKAIGHTKEEATFFETIVSFNQARTLEEKNHFYEQLLGLLASLNKSSKKNEVSQDCFEYYSKWYHGAIRAYLDMCRFKDNFQQIADALYPPISVKDVQISIQLLERLQFIKKDNDGYYIVTDKVITTGDEVISTAVLNFHQQSTKLAYEAINRLSRDKRNITGVMLGISDKSFKYICERLSEVRKEILKIAESDHDAQHVFQLNLHLFPLTDPKKLQSEDRK